ncbi:MAG: hypothetical protein L6R38_008888 [Xanthoria sp. 2 TBL-2021]|nr:MAG: hypothetical protein L6R38_008888 [Xanthoria sp. 2 TBL-2021]
MHYTSIFLAALSATITFAAPSQDPPLDNKLQVTLNGPQTSPAKNTFSEFPRTAQHPSSNGPFTSVELHVGKSVRNPASRCQILDQASKPIVLQRGPNTDITFADGNKGKWTFRDQSSKVSQIICDLIQTTQRRLWLRNPCPAQQPRQRARDPGLLHRRPATGESC